MGIKDLSKVVSPTTQVNIKNIAEKSLAVDAYIELFRGASMQYAANLTNPKGESTLHLTVALSNAVKRKLMGANDVWVWDARDPRNVEDPKQFVLTKRVEVKTSNHDEIKRLEADIDKMLELRDKHGDEMVMKIDPRFKETVQAKRDELLVLKSRNPDANFFNSMIRDVQFILEKLGIRMALAPVGVDAEHLASHLCRAGVVNGVITTDTDVLAYGAPLQYKKVSGKTGVYDQYELKSCLEQTGLVYEQFVEMATALGCDFAEKTPRVGPKTVAQKIKEGKIKFTDAQLNAQKIFKNRDPVKYTLLEPKCTNQSLDELKRWLVVEQGFGAEKVEKTLKPFYN